MNSIQLIVSLKCIKKINFKIKTANNQNGFQYHLKKQKKKKSSKQLIMVLTFGKRVSHASLNFSSVNLITCYDSNINFSKLCIASS